MKKGFTLVELLAVIVVLGVIALISVPQILNVVEDSRKGAFKDSASGLIEAAELYYTQYAGQELELDLSDKNIVKDLNFKGTPPDGGTLYASKEGDFALQMYNSKYCAYKSYSDRDVEIKEGACNFNNLWQISNDNYLTVTTGNIASSYPKVVNGVTIDYDPETQIYTLNGTTITKSFFYNEYYFPKNVPLSATYTITATYLGGTGPTSDVFAIVGLDLATKVNGVPQKLSTRAYTETRLLTQNYTGSKTLTFPSNSADNGYCLYIYFRNENLTFKDYKFKVMLNTGSKQDWVKNLFTTN